MYYNYYILKICISHKRFLSTLYTSVNVQLYLHFGLNITKPEALKIKLRKKNHMNRKSV